MSQLILTSPIRGRMIQPEQPATVEQICTTPVCAAGQWTVQLLSAANALWRVRSATGGSYLVAGMSPACPWCGGDLAIATESYAQQVTNGLHQPMNGMHQPGQAVDAAQWN